MLVVGLNVIFIHIYFWFVCLWCCFVSNIVDNKTHWLRFTFTRLDTQIHNLHSFLWLLLTHRSPSSEILTLIFRCHTLSSNIRNLNIKRELAGRRYLNGSNRSVHRKTEISISVSKFWRCHYISSFLLLFSEFPLIFILNINLYECANQFDGGHLYFAAHTVLLWLHPFSFLLSFISVCFCLFTWLYYFVNDTSSYSR